MTNRSEHSTKFQETKVDEAFSMQSPIFDAIDYENRLVQLIRSNIRKHVLQYIEPKQTMLELNCGTGLDAVYFVEQGLKVHATDNAQGMLKQLEAKVSAQNLQDQLSFQRCSFNELHLLEKKKYDHIFSNFGGLNCAEDLKKVIQSLDEYMKVGSMAHLVIMPRYCIWEFLFALKGNFKLAFRRLKIGGTISQVEGIEFKTYYYSPKYVQQAFGKHYKTISLKAMGCFIPPTYMFEMETKRPNLFRKSISWDAKLAHKWPFYNLGDHYIISVEKTH